MMTDHFKISFAGAWFATAATAYIFAIGFSFYLSTPKIVNPNPPAGGSSFKLYAALPKSEILQQEDIGRRDARAKIIEDFFSHYKTPLYQLGNAFVAVADKYDLDYRLLPAIAMQESNGGKKVIKDSHNPFGYGIYDKLVTKFTSWEEAIEKVGKALKEDYIGQGLKTPTQIMAKYTPPSLEKGGAWAKGVTSFMEELR